MLVDHDLSKERVDELFDEQRAVFADTIAEGAKFRPLAEYFLAGIKVATMRFPSFENYDDMIYKFHMAAWFPKCLKADELIIYMDVTAEVKNTRLSELVESDVFLALKASPDSIIHAAAPYYVNPDVKYPVWNNDLEMTIEHVFGMSDLIDPIHFSITKSSHLLDLPIIQLFLEQNGFEIEYHPPFTPETLEYLNGKGYY